MKLVKEILNEKFEEDSDPIHDLGIGETQRKLKEFRDILSNMWDESYEKYSIKGISKAGVRLEIIEKITEEFDNLFDE